jgi:response regulator RpfG family c-di-GMP phosphodiesterase
MRNSQVPVPAKVQLSPASATREATVLIVDDSDDDRELACYVLRHAGYRILQANAAEQAQRLAEAQENIDVLVSELNLPGMNGMELARWFRDRFPRHESLLVSDSPWEFEAGIENVDWLHFLNKTMALASLAEMVDKLLSETVRHLQGVADGQVPKDTFKE